MDEPSAYRVQTTFHFKGDDIDRQLPVMDLPDFAIGSGVVWSDGKRYRVADSWFSIDHNGVLNDGTHIFLEPCAAEDDTPHKLAPDYYEAEPVQVPKRIR